jgi:alpha-L-rhamnosidase
MPLILTDKPIDWRACYAWSSARSERGLAVRLFRLAFEFSAVPSSLVIHVTADSRYRLLVNGRILGRGPAKGTLEHYGVDTYELAPHLVAGRNILAAEVRWYGENSPLSEVHCDEPGFLVHAPGHPELDTPGGWKVRVDRSVTADTTSYHDNAQQFLNHQDRIDFRPREAEDWTTPRFDDAAWEIATTIGAPVNSGLPWGVLDPRVLHPRDIPLLTEESRRFRGSRIGAQPGPQVHTAAPEPWRIPANAGGTLLLDVGELTTGFPCFQFSGGKDREVRITYAEALGRWTKGDQGTEWIKERRDDPAGQPHGYRDTLILSGGRDRFEPFHWRTFWFILIDVLPGPGPVELSSAGYTRCVFPQTAKAEFQSSDPMAAKIMEISWRTAELCAHETYEDCPYYEQQNYIADSRLQAITSYYLANDTRLARRCLRLFRDSVRADGLIQSRVPSREPQFIPYFCLHWIFMLEDYWMWVGERDVAFVRSCLPVVDGILTFFRERLRADDFVGHVPPWNMVDRHPDWPNGEPPAVLAGESTYLTCLFIQGLEVAIRLHHQAGRSEDALRWMPWPERLRTAVRHGAWDENRGLYLEGPGRHTDRCSQHVQVAAIAGGVARPSDTRRILAKLFADTSLVRCHFMQSFYLARSLESAGAYGHFHRDVLEPWRQMVASNTSTWWEYPDPTRSDCHAWSAWVAADYFSAVLGIKPGHPGWTAITLSPQWDTLDWASGTMLTPAGPVQVEWRRRGGSVTFHAQTPKGVAVELRLPGRDAEQFPSGGTITRVTTCKNPP